MTQEEYKTQVANLRADLEEEEIKVNNLRRKLRILHEEYAHSLEEHYTDYIGRKVRMTFQIRACLVESRFATEKSYEGYFKGFVYTDGYKGNIIPRLAKIKKDGTASKSSFSEWQMESYDKIKNIELI